MAPNIKLELRDLTKNFGNVVAVDSISLQVKEGESVVLLGPSGCGKTTTLRLIAGFMGPDAGSVMIDGKEVASKRIMVPPGKKRGLSMVFQSYAVWPHKTVFQNVSFGLGIKGLPRSVIQEKVVRSLDLVKMGHLAHRYPSELSGGQQQRVSLARALVLEPTLLLLDEPLSNLDATLREEMRYEIKDIQRKLGITTVYVTHDQQEAMVIADRLVVMNAGKIVQIDSPPNVYFFSNNSFVAQFIGLANMLQGKVISVDADRDCFFFESKLNTPLQVNMKGRRIDDINSVKGLFFRPEDIRLSSSESGNEANVFKGKVIRRTFLGSHIDFTLRIENEILRAQSIKRSPFSEGDDVFISLDPDECQPLIE